MENNDDQPAAKKTSRLITNALIRLKKMKAPVLQTASAISSL
jgi:hypothetical protein